MAVQCKQCGCQAVAGSEFCGAACQWCYAQEAEADRIEAEQAERAEAIYAAEEAERQEYEARQEAAQADRDAEVERQAVAHDLGQWGSTWGQVKADADDGLSFSGNEREADPGEWGEAEAARRYDEEEAAQAEAEIAAAEAQAEREAEQAMERYYEDRCDQGDCEPW